MLLYLRKVIIKFKTTKKKIHNSPLGDRGKKIEARIEIQPRVKSNIL
jgi:hypothetical protein